MKLKNQKFNRNEHGFSLVEIIVSMVIMAIASTAFTAMVASQFSYIKLLQDKVHRTSLEKEFKDSLVEHCSSNLVGQTISLNKSRTRDITRIVDDAGSVLVRDGQVNSGLQIGNMVIENKSIDAASSAGKVAVIIPIERVSGTGITSLNPIEAELSVAVNASLRVISCAGPIDTSIDPAGLGRDGWLCSCNGDFTSSTEGGSTVCMKQVNGAIADMWVAPDPWTKATGGNFSCNRGRVPNPPGSDPVLKWRWNNYSRVYTRCNMAAGSPTANATCPI